MCRIYIIGALSSGKTTYAKHLSKLTGIPYFELDSIIYDDSKEKNDCRTVKKQIDIINVINKSNDWIIEGTYRKNRYEFENMLSKYKEKLIVLKS